MTLSRLFNKFFINIRHEFPILEHDLHILSSIHFNAILDVNLESSLTYFKQTIIDEVNVLLSKINKTTCMFDPFPTRLLLDFSQLFIDVNVCIINLTFSNASFPVAFKSAVVMPLFKKPTLDGDILKNFRPVSNLPYLSKLIEKVIAIRLVEHMRQNTIMERFQSAYKAHHSTETALLRVYNDVMFNSLWSASRVSFGTAEILYLYATDRFNNASS